MGAVCNLPGCDKPIVSPNRLACGEVHHLLLMAHRYNYAAMMNMSTTGRGPDSEDPSSSRGTSSQSAFPGCPSTPRMTVHHQPQPRRQSELLLAEFWQRQQAGLCALGSCSSSCLHGELQPSSSPAACSLHAWCSRRHYSQWLGAFYRSLLPDQICMLRPECTRHVFVDLTGTTFHIHRFCGWRHRQQYEMRQSIAGLCSYNISLAAQLNTTSTDDRDIQGSTYRREPSEESLIQALVDYALFNIAPKGIRIVEDFYKQHPWEVLDQPQEVDVVCFLIARCLYKDSEHKRQLITKEGYHWKQHGRPSKVTAEAWKKYYSYRKLLQGKKRCNSEDPDNSSFSTIEFSIYKGDLYSKVKDYCVIRLARHSQRMTEACKLSRMTTGADTEADNSTAVAVAGDQMTDEVDNSTVKAVVGDQITDHLCCGQGATDDAYRKEWDIGTFEGTDLATSPTYNSNRYDELQAMDAFFIHDL